MRFHSRYAALSGLIVLLSFSATAVPTSVVAADTPPCDPLAVPSSVDELGLGFPADELISSSFVNTVLVACPATEQGLVANLLVDITNLTATAFSDVWYVADPQTTITNVDGTVNGMLAFKIDAVGANTPLALESGLADGIFAPGETWYFIMQDYSNVLGLPPSAFGSVGVPSAGLADGSSGSIIAVPVPEPATAALLGLGLVALAARRRARLT